jgi:hypothetical protein
MRMALEWNGEVFPLPCSHLEHGVVYFQLADSRVQLQRAHQGSRLVDAAGGQPADTTALSPGAEEGEEEALAADSVPAEMPGAPVTGDLAPPPTAIGHAIIASAPAPPRRARAQAKQRPRR